MKKFILLGVAIAMFASSASYAATPKAQTSLKARILQARLLKNKKVVNKPAVSTGTTSNNVFSGIVKQQIGNCPLSFPTFTGVYNTGWMTKGYTGSYSGFYWEAANRTSILSVFKSNVSTEPACGILENKVRDEYTRYRNERDKLGGLFNTELQNLKNSIYTLWESLVLSRDRLLKEFNVCQAKNEMSVQDYLLGRIYAPIKLNCGDDPDVLLGIYKSKMDSITHTMGQLYK